MSESNIKLDDRFCDSALRRFNSLPMEGNTMTTNTSRRAVLAGVAAAPVLAVPLPAVAAAPAAVDPIFAAIENHRRLYKKYCDISRQRDEHPDGAKTSAPCVTLSPRRDCKVVRLEKSENCEIYRTDWLPPTGQYYYASTVEEIKLEASDIPREHRDEWLADRIADLRKQQRAIAKTLRDSGYRQLEKQEEAAWNAAYSAGQKLLATAPTTIAGVLALVAYAIKDRGDGGLMPDEEDKYILLESVAWALGAHVPDEIARGFVGGKAVRS